MEPRDAGVLAIDSSGRAVVFRRPYGRHRAVRLVFLNLDFLRSLAGGASVAVMMTMLSAITLLPAILGFVGYNVDKLPLTFRTWLGLQRKKEPFAAAIEW